MTNTTETMSVECLHACPLCDEMSWRTLPVPGHWIGSEVFGALQGKLSLVKCRGCGLVFINPRPSSESLSAFYSGNTYSCHEAVGSASSGTKADYLLDRIAKCLPADAPHTLLDYGAGGGGFLAHARKRGWKVRGFEPGKRGLESCQREGLDVTDRLEDLPSGEFGLITLHHVFEHLANPVKVLDGISRLLAPQGRLYIEVPNAHSLRARLAAPLLSRRFHVDERYRAFPIHLMHYSDRTLREIMKRAGWQVESTFTSGMGLDEFFIHPETVQMQTTRSDRSQRAVSPRRRLRHHLRDAFLSLGFGENLATIAYPIRSRVSEG